MAVPDDVPWELIREAYVQDPGATIVALAKHFKIDKRYLRRRIAAEKWNDEREAVMQEMRAELRRGFAMRLAKETESGIIDLMRQMAGLRQIAVERLITGLRPDAPPELFEDRVVRIQRNQDGTVDKRTVRRAKIRPDNMLLGYLIKMEADLYGAVMLALNAPANAPTDGIQDSARRLREALGGIQQATGGAVKLGAPLQSQVTKDEAPEIPGEPPFFEGGEDPGGKKDAQLLDEAQNAALKDLTETALRVENAGHGSNSRLAEVDQAHPDLDG